MTPGRFLAALGACVLALALGGCGHSVSTLQERGDVPALVKIAEEPGQDYTKVSDAVDAIGEIGTPAAVDVLVGWVSGDDDSLRIAAVPALGKTGDPKGVAPLVERIGELDPEDRSGYEMDLRALVVALGGIRSPQAAKALLAQADAGSSEVVGEAHMGRALAGQGKGIEPELVRRLSSKGSDVYLPCGVALYVLNADDKARVAAMLGAKGTQRVWAGVFTEAGEYAYRDALVRALDRFGDVPLAGRMLNSGDDRLEQAARDWAAEHGYSIQETLKFGSTD